MFSVVSNIQSNVNSDIDPSLSFLNEVFTNLDEAEFFAIELISENQGSMVRIYDKDTLVWDYLQKIPKIYQQLTAFRSN